MQDPVICFDLGGVLVRVAYTWSEAVEAAGIAATPSLALESGLSDCPGFDAYQRGEIDEAAYYEALRAYLALETHDQARMVHRWILIEPFPDTLELVQELHERGYATACLSNTNAPHWDVLGDPELYPAIASLKTPVLSHEIGLEKPELNTYRAFENIVSAPARRIVFFDDNEANVEAAVNVGWHARRIDPKANPAKQLRQHLSADGLL